MITVITQISTASWTKKLKSATPPQKNKNKIISTALGLRRLFGGVKLKTAQKSNSKTDFEISFHQK